MAPLTSASGVFALNTSFAEMLQVPGDTRYVRIFDRETREFLHSSVEGAGAPGDWIAVESLAGLGLEASGRFLIRGWGADRGASDWVSLTATVAETDEGLGSLRFDANTAAADSSVALSDLLDVRDLDSGAHVRVYTEAKDYGWLRPEELDALFLGTGAAGEDSQLWVDTWNPLHGRSGWVSQQLTFVESEPEPDPALFQFDTLALNEGEVDEGIAVTVTAVVTNTGDETGTQDVELEVNGAVQGIRAVTLDGGDSEPVSFDLDTDALGAGSYSLRVASDDDQTGEQTLTVDAEPAPDPDPAFFEVAELALSDDPVEEGTTVTVTAVVANSGAETGTQDVELEVNGAVQGTRAVTLDGGDSEPVSFDLDTDARGAGSYSLRVASDDDQTGEQTLTVDPEPTAVFVIDAIEFVPEVPQMGDPFDLTVRYEELTGEDTGTVDLRMEIEDAGIDENVRIVSHTSASAYSRTFSDLEIEDPGDYHAMVTLDAPNASETTFTETIEIVDPATLPPSLVIDTIEVVDSHMLEPDETFSVEVDLSETAGIATENLTVQLTIDGTGIDETETVGVLEDDSTTVTFSGLETDSVDGFEAVVTLDGDNADDPVTAGQRFTVSNHPHAEVDYPEGLELLWHEDATASPFDAIGQVVVDQGGGSFTVGSGFMISPQHFMTNAHVVELGGSLSIPDDGVDIDDLSGDIDSMGLLLGHNGTWPVGGAGDPFPDEQVFGDRVWSLGGGTIAGEPADFTDDLAIVRLEEPLPGSVAHFDWYWNEPDGDRDLTGETLSWAGYPHQDLEQDKDPGSSTPPEFYMWQTFGEITDYDREGGQLNLTPEMEGRGGTSGSPLFIEVDGSPHFVGAYAGRVTDRSDDLQDIGAGAALTPEAHDWALQIVQADGHLGGQEYAV